MSKSRVEKVLTGDTFLKSKDHIYIKKFPELVRMIREHGGTYNQGAFDTPHPSHKDKELIWFGSFGADTAQWHMYLNFSWRKLPKKVKLTVYE